MADWYSVKLLHKIIISGLPEQDKLDEFYHNANEFFEERVVLVQASSFDEAYRIAEREAKDNNDIYENKYGQIVEHDFYKSLDCYHLFEAPQASAEVYSTFFSKKQNEDEQKLLNEKYNSCTIEEMHVLRHA
ncbi:DUF4288 domain-containing protein [Sporobacter termitidis]|uniref:DUF4288 domain-containing protein n=1 Tax=Sporobacter termitidis TaxID=44749 RepID=UPI0009321D3D|nr:DUF4288 domain-containing protein [Sporobacter termitidis]